MPELEKRKAEIARKRELYNPIDHSDIQEHAKRLDEV
jgi:hypothetical protein